MNKLRRSKIENIITKLSNLEDCVNDILNEEQECFDNIPENLQESERGEEMQRCIEALEAANDSLCECIEILEEI